MSIEGDHIVQNTACTAEISAPNMFSKYDIVMLCHKWAPNIMICKMYNICTVFDKSCSVTFKRGQFTFFNKMCSATFKRGQFTFFNKTCSGTFKRANLPSLIKLVQLPLKETNLPSLK